MAITTNVFYRGIRPAPSSRAGAQRTGWRVAVRALRVHNYRLYAIGNLVSTTGTWMQMVAQNWLVLRLTGSVSAVGVTVALQALPSVAFGLHGGGLADRFSKRRILLATQTTLALFAASLGLLVATGAVTVWMVYALAVAVGCVTAVDGPTAGAFGPELVGPEDLSNAAALGSAANSAGRVLGMAAAGIAISIVGMAPIFFANALSYLAVVGALGCMRTAELRATRSARGRERRLRHAFSGIRRQPVILGVFVLAFAVAAFGRNYQVTMATMSAAVFHRGAGGYGLLSTVFGIGAFVGAVVAARVPKLGLRILVAAAFAAGALEIVAAAMPDIHTFAACILPIALVAVLIDTTFGVVVALGVDETVRGRALALLGMTSTAGAAIGGPLLGWSAQHVGGRPTLVVAGTVSLVVALAVGAALREYLGGLTRLTQVTPGSCDPGAQAAPPHELVPGYLPVVGDKLVDSAA